MRQIAETSLEAYEYLKKSGVLTQRQQEVYFKLLELGRATGKEIASKLKKPYHTISGRLTELRNAGLIKIIDRIKEEGSRTSSRVYSVNYNIKGVKDV